MKLPNHIQAALDKVYIESRVVHEDTLSKDALIRRIAENKRIQDEKDRLYDEENPKGLTFVWEEV